MLKKQEDEVTGKTEQKILVQNVVKTNLWPSSSYAQYSPALPAKEHSSSPQFTTGWVHFILKTALFEKTKLPVTALTCPLQYFPRESCYQGLASTHSLFVNQEEGALSAGPSSRHCSPRLGHRTFHENISWFQPLFWPLALGQVTAEQCLTQWPCLIWSH